MKEQEGENAPIGLILCAEKSNERNRNCWKWGKTGYGSRLLDGITFKSELEGSIESGYLEAAKERISNKKKF